MKQAFQETSAPLSAGGVPPVVVTSHIRYDSPVVKNALGLDDAELAKLLKLLPDDVKQNIEKQYRELPVKLRQQYLGLISAVGEAIEKKRDSLARGTGKDDLDQTFAVFGRKLNEVLEYEKRRKALEEGLVKASAQMDEVLGKCGAGDSAIESVRKDLQLLKQLVADATKEVAERKSNIADELQKIKEQSRHEIETRISELLSAHEGQLCHLENRVKELCSLSTIGVFSNEFEKKRHGESVSMWVKSGLFYVSLIALALLGCWTVNQAFEAVDPSLTGVTAARAYLAALPRAAAYCLPFYLPLIWFACHMNRLMNQARRLMEEYAHKVVVAQTYSGVADQAVALAQSGVESAKDMSVELMRNTIAVLCSNPNKALDKIKTVTPLSEVADCVARLAAAVKDIKSTSSNEAK